MSDDHSERLCRGRPIAASIYWTPAIAPSESGNPVHLFAVDLVVQ